MPGPCTPSIRIPSTSAVFDGPVTQITLGSFGRDLIAVATVSRRDDLSTRAICIQGAKAPNLSGVLESSSIRVPVSAIAEVAFVIPKSYSFIFDRSKFERNSIPSGRWGRTKSCRFSGQ